MKHLLLFICLADLLLPAPANAQSVLGTYKYRVDTSIINKTAASSVTRGAIGGRLKELADIAQAVSDNSVHTSDLNAFSKYSDTAAFLAPYARTAVVVPQTRTITINGTALDLSQNRSWTISGGGGSEADPVWVAAATAYRTKIQNDLLYAPLSHPHIIADVTGLQATIDAKAALSHAHTLSNLTQSGATTGQTAVWNGTAWAPATVSGGGPVTATYGATTTINIDNASFATLTLTGNTILAFSGTPVDGQAVVVAATASGADRTITIGSSFIIPSSSTVTSPVTVASATETVFAFRWKASVGKWRVVSLVPGY